jgi:hypothetical protein
VRGNPIRTYEGQSFKLKSWHRKRSVGMSPF